VPIKEDIPIRRVNKEVETKDKDCIDLDNLSEDSSDEASLVLNDSIMRNVDLLPFD